MNANITLRDIPLSLNIEPDIFRSLPQGLKIYLARKEYLGYADEYCEYLLSYFLR